MAYPFPQNTQRNIPILNDASARVSSATFAASGTAADISAIPADLLFAVYNTSATETVFLRFKNATQTSDASLSSFDDFIPAGQVRHIALDDATTAVSVIATGAATLIYTLKG